MHKTLERQVRRIIGDITALPPQWQELLKEINQTYEHFDEDRELVGRSLEISSRELGSLNVQLKEEKAKLQASINSLSMGFIITDNQNNIVLMNNAAKSILYKHKISTTNGNTISPKSLAEIKHQLEDKIDLQSMAEACMNKKTVIETKEISIENLFLRVLLSPILIANNQESIGAVIVLEDITQEKIMDQLKDEFLAVASHELRTPLTSIKGYLSLVKDYFEKNVSDQEITNMLNASYESTERLITIVNDFLDASRLEQGKFVLDITECDIRDIISNAIEESQILAAKKSLSIVNTTPMEPIIVKADKDRLKQVLINLLGNSIKYTDQGSISILPELLKEKGLVKVSVTDTGKGIPDEMKGLLFHKFQQANKDYFTRETGGTGLGLYISKLLINVMGGEITLERSEQGKGSTFSFTLPAKI